MNKNNLKFKIGWLVILIFGLIWLNKLISLKAIDISNLLGQQEAQKLKNQSTSELSTKYSQVSVEAQKVESLLPEKNNFSNFVDYFELLAKKNELENKFNFENNLPLATNIQAKPNTNQPADKKTAESTKFITFQTELTGLGSNIVNFIVNLETGPYFITIQNFELKSPDGYSLKSSAILEIKLYVDENF